MKNSFEKIIVFGLLLMLLFAPFAGFAPLMLILLAFGVYWMIGSLIQAFFSDDVPQKNEKAGFDSSGGE
jgi:Na+-transporting methylmalonyl-CoA/oxaloacetate decarboxylase gamma subunit